MKSYRYTEMLERPAPVWLIEGMILENSIGLFYGAPKSFKSFLVHYMMAYLGCPSITQFARRAINKHVRVLYVLGEGAPGFTWRMESWKLSHSGVSVEEYDDAVRISIGAVQLTKPDSVTLLIKHAQEIGAEMVVFDTYSRMMLGIPENDNGLATLAVEQLERIRREVGNVAVVHHSQKDGEEPRGASALMGAIDYSVRITKDPINKLRVAWHCRAMKDGSEYDPLEFDMVTYGPSVVPEYDDGSRSPGAELYGPAPRMTGSRDRSLFPGTGSPF